jgi:CheY-like chemotaxis protein
VSLLELVMLPRDGNRRWYCSFSCFLLYFYAVVVEDNRVNRIIAERLIRRLGHDVFLADNGAEGVRAVRESEAPFDLVLVDCQMPVMDGVSC